MLLGSFGLQVLTLFLFAKRLFLEVVFSYSNTPPTPQNSSTLKLSLSLL
ncbi:hypothetical protein HPHPP30_0033 [Helicobacter pylori Hp P-30]|nr:hypothetical protein HPHPP30_0033 [Helicobacter pylori Hp P-30]